MSTPLWIIGGLVVAAGIFLLWLTAASRRADRAEELEREYKLAAQEDRYREIQADLAANPSWPKPGLCAETAYHFDRIIGSACERCGHNICGIMGAPCDLCATVNYLRGRS